MNTIYTEKAMKIGTLSSRRPGRVVRSSLRDDGQSLIELALVAPLFFALLLGAAEFGRLAYDSIEVSNAARAAVAYGAQSAATAADLAGIQQAAIDDGANLTGLVVARTLFCSCSNAPDSPIGYTPADCSGAAAACGAARVLNYVKVNTSASIDPLIHLPGLPTTFNLNGQAIMRVEQ